MMKNSSGTSLLVQQTKPLEYRNHWEALIVTEMSISSHSRFLWPTQGHLCWQQCLLGESKLPEWIVVAKGIKRMASVRRSILLVMAESRSSHFCPRHGSDQTIVFPKNYAGGPGGPCRPPGRGKGQHPCGGLEAKPLEAVAICHFKSTKTTFAVPLNVTHIFVIFDHQTSSLKCNVTVIV